MNKIGKPSGPEQPDVRTEYPDPQAAARAPGPGATDRPGFDLGGSVSDATAGTGLGAGDDASENPLDRGIPGHRTRTELGLPRFSGAVRERQGEAMPENFVEGTELEGREAFLAGENAALRDRLLRALAEVENTKHQAERTGSDARQYAVLEFARGMLGVADNLQRAIAAAEGQQRWATEDAPLIEGVRATERMLESTFERFGVQKLSPLGNPFDPNLHEAVMQVDDASSPPGTVAKVLEDGYTLHDRLVRPARVAIVGRYSNSSIAREAVAPGFVQHRGSPNHHR